MANITNITTPNPAGGSPCTPEAHQRTVGEEQAYELRAAYVKAAVLLGNIKRGLGTSILIDPRAAPLLDMIITLDKTISDLHNGDMKMYSHPALSIEHSELMKPADSQPLHLVTKHFDIKIDQAKGRGYFEHHKYGDEFGGSLRFNGRDLADYDGVSALPAEVVLALVNVGFNMTDEGTSAKDFP